MIKVIMKEANAGVMIKVVGKPRQFVTYFGKTGETVTCGRYAGQKRANISWGHPQYTTSPRQAIKNIHEILSEEWRVPEGDQNIEGIDGWEKAANEYEKLIALTEEIGKQFGGFIEKYGEVAHKIDKSNNASCEGGEGGDDLDDDLDDDLGEGLDEE